ncbi:MFS transporter [Halalkalibacterium halodurans]|nr:MFS transporter [Halalkalibacterium halodurans]
MMRFSLDNWKYPMILLFSIGISSIGVWVYFIALNLIVFQMTGSALAVAALYLIRPLATIVTNWWCGSVIDRMNKKRLMIGLDVIQGGLITLLAIASSSLWLIYVLVFFIHMAASVYHPTSMSYITRLIPAHQRQRFNSLRSLLDSGAFFIGPAITGVLFLIGTPVYAIIINAGALFFSAVVTCFMPNVEKEQKQKKVKKTKRMSLHLLKDDWRFVISFSRMHVYVISVYVLFSGFIVMQTAIDSLEVAFSKEVLLLTDSEYGFLVSLAGAGILVGSFLNVAFAKKWGISYLIGIGSVFVAVGYLIFAFSSSFVIASVGVFVLALANAFANTGFMTFYQNNIPVEVMGRIASLYGLVEAALIIAMTTTFAVSAQFFSVKLVVASGAILTLFLTLVLCAINLFPGKQAYYVGAPIEEKG